MAKKDSGGGLTSNKLVRPEVRTGTGAKGVKPGYTSQLGSMKGTHVTDRAETPASGALITKDAIRPPAGGNQRLGNELATNVGKGGPGAGRTLYGQSGTNCQYGAADPGNPAKPSIGPKDILSDFGPERGKR